uniref:Uncharacterized protein n=2 Tax=Magallana gigas TaxID=29159 RepID=A0A8W8MUJ0_MAGGI
MELSIQIFICSYVNWCSSCSNVQIETAVNVSTVDWSGCTATRQYSMTVTNSDSVVLYRNSTSCCSGNLTIHYNIDQYSTVIDPGTNNNTQMNKFKNNTHSYHNITEAVILFSFFSAVILSNLSF